jgi:hypothetical protein
MFQTIEIDGGDPPDATVIGPSTYFANNEVWNWELVFLSFVGTANLSAVGTYTTAYGGVGRRLTFNVGMSQMGDINLVRSGGHAMFGPDRPYIVHSNDINAGAWFGFDPKRPYSLPPDSGIAATVRNDNPTYNIDNLGLLLTGYEQPDGARGPRNPVHLGGHARAELTPGTDYVIDHPDMYNDGQHPCTLTDMILNGFFLNEQSVDYDTLDQVSWRVNPSTGPLWMPDPAPIPVGCIAPFNRSLFDIHDEGPRAYVFPEGTILRPRQRLSVEVLNRDAEQAIGVCLFGYLEVT